MKCIRQYGPHRVAFRVVKKKRRKMTKRWNQKMSLATVLQNEELNRCSSSTQQSHNILKLRSCKHIQSAQTTKATQKILGHGACMKEATSPEIRCTLFALAMVYIRFSTVCALFESHSGKQINPGYTPCKCTLFENLTLRFQQK